MTPETLLRDLLRRELSSLPPLAWRFFYPVQLAVWRFIQAKRPGVLGPLEAGMDDDPKAPPYFRGRGSQWFMHELGERDDYLTAMEQILHPLIDRIPKPFSGDQPIPEADLPAIPEEDVAKLAHVVLAATDDAIAGGRLSAESSPAQPPRAAAGRPTPLADAFMDYLGTALEAAEARRLAGLLDAHGLHELGRALRIDAEGRAASESWRISSGPWQGRTCRAGRKVPADAAPGELWIDTVELLTMILLPDPDDPSPQRWCSLATHPVRVWQFETFRRLVELGGARTEFAALDDYLDEQRFATQPESAFVTDLYHDEAVAYADWFQKFLGGMLGYEVARRVLGRTLGDALFGGLRLWDGTEVPGNEALRLAFGSDNLERSLADELAEVPQKGYRARPNRLIFEEDERSPRIGCSVEVPLQIGLIPADQRSETWLYRLENAAPRD